MSFKETSALIIGQKNRRKKNKQPQSLEKVKPVKYKKDKDFFKKKKIFVFSPFIRTEILNL